MKASEFCYWLQGHFEMNPDAGLSLQQLDLIKRHLNMVFAHDLDKNVPDGVSSKLNEIHGKPTTVFRC